jgi:undecaprenyl-diphosphatase
MVTMIVVLTGAAAGVVAFVLSAVRALPDPIDPARQERAVRRRLARHPRLRRFLRQRLDRRTAGGLVLTVSLLVTLAVALIVGAVLDMIGGSFGFASLDGDIAHWGVGNADPTGVEILTVITYLGDTLVVVAALLVTGVIDFLRHRRGEVFAFLAAVIIGEKLIVNGLKGIIGRGRPDVLQLIGWDGPSFPSGHAAAATAAWPAIALVLGRGCGRPIRALLAAGAALIAIAVAASRALLGVHWFTDIVAGVAIGYGWFLVCAVVFGGRVQHLGDPLTDRLQGTRTAPDQAAAPSFRWRRIGTLRGSVAVAGAGNPRQTCPERDQQHERRDCGHDAGCGAGDHVEGQQDDTDDGGTEQDKTDDRQTMGDADHQFACMPAKQYAVQADRRDEESGGGNRKGHRDQVDRPLVRAQLFEPGLERQGQQEAREQLHAGLHDPQLLEQVGPVSVQPLHRSLIARC